VLYDILLAPFADDPTMRRALVSCLALALGGGPVGVLLVLRRMALMGDALAHTVMPGAAVGFVIGGLSLPAMAAGGIVAGLTVALLSGAAARATGLREDASFAGFFTISLAAGVLIVSLTGASIDLEHVLFGDIAAIDRTSMLLVAGLSSLTLLVLAAAWRPILAESFDPEFLRAAGSGGRWHMLFLTLVVFSLVAGFQALGTLMALGIIILPAVAARLWARDVARLAGTAIGIAVVSCYAGLLVAWHLGTPSGPSIVLIAGAVYVVSLLVGRNGGILRRSRPAPHHHG
jgi:zinc/manganese transport system permease protein